MAKASAVVAASTVFDPAVICKRAADLQKEDYSARREPGVQSAVVTKLADIFDRPGNVAQALKIGEVSEPGLAWARGEVKLLDAMLADRPTTVTGRAFTPEERKYGADCTAFLLGIHEAIDLNAHTKRERKDAQEYKAGAMRGMLPAWRSLDQLIVGYKTAPYIWTLAQLEDSDLGEVRTRHVRMKGILGDLAARLPRSQEHQVAENERTLRLQIWEEHVVGAASRKLPRGSAERTAVLACLPRGPGRRAEDKQKKDDDKAGGEKTAGGGTDAAKGGNEGGEA